MVENRQRTEQRLLQLAEQSRHWQERQHEARHEIENQAAQDVELEEQATVLEAQVQDQAEQLPALEDALRRAQQQANEQRGSVMQVQQQIQVLAAEQRSIDEQMRQQTQRRDRLQADRNALAAPEATQLSHLQTQLAGSEEQLEMLQARVNELQEQVPQLDEQRSQAQQTLNDETRKQADLAARLEALKALQEKVRTDGKLNPWLQKHGLSDMQQLWTRLHIQKGWENALEAASPQHTASGERSSTEITHSYVADSATLDLRQLSPAESNTTVHIRATASNIRVLLAAPPADVEIFETVSDVEFVPTTEEASMPSPGPRLRIEATASSITVEHPQ